MNQFFVIDESVVWNCWTVYDEGAAQMIKGVSLANAPSTAELIYQYICFCPSSIVTLCSLYPNMFSKLSIIANNIKISHTMICEHIIPQTRP